VYPGLVATELIDAPGNEPLVGGPEPIPATELAAAVLAGLADGAAEVYAPAWFKDVAAAKAKDVDAFLAGTADYVKQQRGAAPS
jgi:hypothetical protein